MIVFANRTPPRGGGLSANGDYFMKKRNLFLAISVLLVIISLALFILALKSRVLVTNTLTQKSSNFHTIGGFCKNLDLYSPFLSEEADPNKPRELSLFLDSEYSSNIFVKVTSASSPSASRLISLRQIDSLEITETDIYSVMGITNGMSVDEATAKLNEEWLTRPDGNGDNVTYCYFKRLGKWYKLSLSLDDNTVSKITLVIYSDGSSEFI